MSKTERLVCGDCKATFEVSTEPRGSAIIEKLLWVTLVVPGFIYGMWRKAKPKKSCDYCGSTFLLPDSHQTHELLKPIEKVNSKNNSYPHYPI